MTAGLALAPLRAFAGVCESLRPGWDGAPVSALQEAAYLFTTPLSLVLLLATALAVRLRSQWGVLAVCLGWSGLVSLYAFFDPTDGAAMAEGCAGSPVLFILAVATICVAAVLLTGVPDKPASDETGPDA